jgi:hypothetical protein
MTISRRDLIRRAGAFAALMPAFKAFGHAADSVITAPDQALDVFDFERVARAKLPPAHWGYLATGVDGDGRCMPTARVRELRRASPSPRGYQRHRHVRQSLRHEMGDAHFPDPSAASAHSIRRQLAVARAARSKKHLQFLSTVTSTGVEDVTDARGAPIWYQLYPTDQWAVTQALVRRAEAAGCPVLALTVDLQAGSNRLTAARSVPLDPRDCATCHGSKPPRWFEDMARKPMFKCLDLSAVTDITPIDMTWDYIKRLRDIWPRKLIVKGIVTREDAELAVAHGLDGLVVSNHGGRAEDSAAQRSKASRKWSPASAAGCPCWWTAVSGAAPTFSRRWRSAPPRSASVGRISGALRRSGRKALRKSSTSCARN